MRKNTKYFILNSIVIISFLFLNSCSKVARVFDPEGGEYEYSLSFTPAGTPVDNSVYLETNPKGGLDIKIKGGSNIYGAVIEINYDKNRITSNSASAYKGGYLSQDGINTAFMIKDDNEKGKVIIGIYRVGNVQGINGDGVLANIHLFAKKTYSYEPLKNSPINFGTLNCTLKSPSENIVGTTWLGGTFDGKETFIYHQ